VRVYHYLEARWALDDIRKRRLKISAIDDTNDPYEFACVRSDDERSQRVLDTFARGWADDYRVHCFSWSWSNVLMWSHYAERHKGICLGFDVPEGCAKNVEYVGEVKHIGVLRTAVADENDEILKHLIWTKYEGWSYEQEVRLTGRKVNMTEDGGPVFVPFGEQLHLKEVIAGPRFSLGRNVIDRALSGYSGVVVIKAKCSASGFEVVADHGGFADGDAPL